ncbi:MAG: zinc ribbon domain-containing protein [Ruminococcus sp.]|nr:zinc ribbon domain-containing protein [Ruminococcus sp.]
MRKTYAYNSIFIGIMLALLVQVSTENIVLAVITLLGVSILGFVVIRALENAFYKAGDMAVDKAMDAYTKRKQRKMQENAAPNVRTAVSADWVCSCGHTNPQESKFCGMCGAAKPADAPAAAFDPSADTAEFDVVTSGDIGSEPAAARPNDGKILYYLLIAVAFIGIIITIVSDQTINQRISDLFHSVNYLASIHGDQWISMDKYELMVLQASIVVMGGAVLGYILMMLTKLRGFAALVPLSAIVAYALILINCSTLDDYIKHDNDIIIFVLLGASALMVLVYMAIEKLPVGLIVLALSGGALYFLWSTFSSNNIYNDMLIPWFNLAGNPILLIILTEYKKKNAAYKAALQTEQDNESDIETE